MLFFLREMVLFTQTLLNGCLRLGDKAASAHQGSCEKRDTAGYYRSKPLHM